MLTSKKSPYFFSKFNGILFSAVEIFSSDPFSVLSSTTDLNKNLTKIVQRLNECTLSPNYRHPDTQTPLIFAATRLYTQDKAKGQILVCAILETGGDPNIQRKKNNYPDDQGDTFLNEMLRSGTYDKSTMQLLFTYGFHQCSFNQIVTRPIVQSVLTADELQIDDRYLDTWRKIKDAENCFKAEEYLEALCCFEKASEHLREIAKVEPSPIIRANYELRLLNCARKIEECRELSEKTQNTERKGLINKG